MSELYFKLGENLGKVLMDIAIEHIVYNYDFDKGLNSLTLSGISKEIALRLISGSYVLYTSSPVEVTAEPRRSISEKELKDNPNKYGVGIDLFQFVNDELSKFLKEAGSAAIAKMKIDRFIFVESTDISIILPFAVKSKLIRTGDMGVILAYIQDNILETDDKLEQMLLTNKVLNRFLTRFARFQQLLDKFREYYPGFDDLYRKRFHTHIATSINQIVDEILAATFKPDDPIEEYLTSAKKLNESLKKPVKPLPVDGEIHDAGWIAPNGDYYALNGDIADYLHEVIADRLLEAGIIKASKEDTDISASQILEQDGWVRQHDNRILYAGYLYSSIGKDEIPITPQQINTMCALANHHYNSILKLGLEMQRYTVSEVLQMDELALRRVFSV